jgi:hypothetical protein
MRFQFRLRTLFAVVTVAAVAFAWIGHEAHVVPSEGHEIGPGTISGFVPLAEGGVSDAKRRFG